MKCVILASGLGSRLHPFTMKMPKPMLPILNRPVLEHLICKVKEAGISEVLINLHYLPERMIEYFGDGSKYGVKITWRFEDKLTGPAGALVVFEDLLKNDSALLVLSGDGIHDINLKVFINEHIERESSLTVVMKRMEDPGRYGVMDVDRLNRLTSFVEKPILPKKSIGLVSCGVYCLNPGLIKNFPRQCIYDYGDLIKKMLNDDQPVYGFLTSSYWSDIGTPNTLLQTNLEAVQGETGLNMEGQQLGANIIVGKDAVVDPNAQIKGPVLIGEGAHIHSGACVVGPVVIGAGCTISEKSYIREAVLFPGTVVPSGTTLIGGLYEN